MLNSLHYADMILSLLNYIHHIGGAMLCIPAQSTPDCTYESLSGQSITTQLVFATFPLSTEH